MPLVKPQTYESTGSALETLYLPYRCHWGDGNLLLSLGFGYGLFSRLWAIKQGMLPSRCLHSMVGFTQSKDIWLHSE